MNVRQVFGSEKIRSATTLQDGVTFVPSLIPKTVVVSAGGISHEIVDETVRTTQSNAEIYTEGEIAAVNETNKLPTFQSLDEDILTVSNTGVIQRQGDGVGRVLVKVGDYTKRIDVDVTQSTQDSTQTGAELLLGSFGFHVYTAIKNATDGKTKAANSPIYSSQDHATRTFARSADVWTGSWDLTCASPSNSNYNNKKAGTAITPRHIVGVAHYTYPVGTKVYFVDNDGATIERTVVGRMNHPNYVNPNANDFTLYLLDEDLPASITPCKLPPPIISEVTTNMGLANAEVPFFGIDQEEKVLIYRAFGFTETSLWQGWNLLDTDFAEFWEAPVVGDSGNPWFMPSGEDLMLIYLFGINPLWHYEDTINSMIQTLESDAGVDSGHSPTIADLSIWPNFESRNYIIEDSQLASSAVASLWVESPDINSKPSYRMLETPTDFWELYWDGAQWTFLKYGNPDSVFSDSSATGDTPTTGSFSTLNFSNS